MHYGVTDRKERLAIIKELMSKWKLHKVTRTMIEDLIE